MSIVISTTSMPMAMAMVIYNDNDNVNDNVNDNDSQMYGNDQCVNDSDSVTNTIRLSNTIRALVSGSGPTNFR